MLSLELIGIVGLLFGFVVCLMVVSQLGGKSARIPEKAEKGPERGGEPVRTEQ